MKLFLLLDVGKNFLLFVIVRPISVVLLEEPTILQRMCKDDLEVTVFIDRCGNDGISFS